MVQGNTQSDVERGQWAAELLHTAFSSTGIHGQTAMPEDLLPTGVARGSLDHLLFITLTVAIDYQRDAIILWQSSRDTFEDSATRYLYDPKALHEVGLDRVREDMQRHGLSKKPNQDAWIWRTVAATFHKKWTGDPRKFLADCGWGAPTVLDRLKNDVHPQLSRRVNDYPYLRGAKIGPLWLRMLRDNVGLSELKRMERVPIPVDIHVARATLCLGVVRGTYHGPLSDLFEHIRSAWSTSVEGLEVHGRPMIALDVDEPLWHLSKYGCSRRGDSTVTCPLRGRCDAGSMCVGGLVKIKNGKVDLET